MKNTLPVATLAFLLIASVLLNGVHAKDVLNMSAQTDGSQASKVVADVHPHVDKQLHKLMHDAFQMDGRSLRLRDYKKMNLNGVKNLLNSWRDQLSLYLG